MSKLRCLAALLACMICGPGLAADNGNVVAYETITPASVTSARPTCASKVECEQSHALVFIHGIYGSAETFASPQMDWPTSIPATVNGKRVDVYIVDYRTKLLAWLKKDIASLDEVVYAVFDGMRRQVLANNYASIGLIGHSLGGNVATSYLHTVKTELGHDARARHSFVLTLGTPTDGAEIAAVGLYLKQLLLMPDPLLTSLKTDNTFLRMLAHWRYSENAKATAFDCRPIGFHAGLEGKSLYGVKIVSAETATFMDDFNFHIDYRTFDELDHSSIAKPTSKDDGSVYAWANDIMTKEFDRADRWRAAHADGNLCRKIY